MPPALKFLTSKLHGSLSVEYENADGQACHFLISDYYHPTYTGKDIGLLAQLATPNNKLTSDKYLEALRATGKLSKIVEQSPVISVRFLWPRADRFELDYFLFDRH